jgi:hypothetical protein
MKQFKEYIHSVSNQKIEAERLRESVMTLASELPGTALIEVSEKGGWSDSIIRTYKIYLQKKIIQLHKDLKRAQDPAERDEVLSLQSMAQSALTLLVSNKGLGALAKLELLSMLKASR